MSSVLDSEGLVVKTTRASGAAAFRLSISSCVRYQCACEVAGVSHQHATSAHTIESVACQAEITKAGHQERVETRKALDLAAEQAPSVRLQQGLSDNMPFLACSPCSLRL